MDRQQLKQEAKSLSDRASLLDLLNRLKRDNLGEKARLFKMKHLVYFSKPGCNSKSYHQFTIPKKSGGFREISAPSGILKSLQTNMAEILQAVYEPTSSVTGFVKGRSVQNNAELHVGKNYVFNIDLKDFFSSISQARVWGALQSGSIGFSKEVANAIAGTCCTLVPFCNGEPYTYDNEEDDNHQIEFFSVLPQGSPASPVLTNIVCQNLDRRLKGLARRFGVAYSRYADDITFSSMHNVYQSGGEFITELRRIIEDQNFRLNDKKTRLQRRGERQIVTGLIVNEKVNVSRSLMRSIGSVLYIWERYGYDSAVASFTRHTSLHRDYSGLFQKYVSMESVIGGRISYLKMIRGNNDPATVKLSNRYKSLIDAMTPKRQDINYIASYSIEEFYRLFNTTISFSVYNPDEDNPVPGIKASSIINGKLEHICISDRCKELLLQSAKLDSVQLLVSPDFKESLKAMYISLCQSLGNPFWLLMISYPRKRYANTISREVLSEMQ